MQNAIIAILAAGLAGWVFGAIWYTSLSKPWQRAHGINPEDCKDQKMPMMPLLVAFLGAIVMAAVLYQVLIDLGVIGVSQGAIAGLTLGGGLSVHRHRGQQPVPAEELGRHPDRWRALEPGADDRRCRNHGTRLISQTDSILTLRC